MQSGVRRSCADQRGHALRMDFDGAGDAVNLGTTLARARENWFPAKPLHEGRVQSASSTHAFDRSSSVPLPPASCTRSAYMWTAWGHTRTRSTPCSMRATSSTPILLLAATTACVHRKKSTRPKRPQSGCSTISMRQLAFQVLHVRNPQTGSFCICATTASPRRL